MHEVVVVSGKGGTGKTFLVTAFAELAGRPVVLGDCDVSASNLHLLLPGEEIREEPFLAGHHTVVDSDGCVDCHLCGDVCAVDAISFPGGAAEIDVIRCEGCGECVTVCPAGGVHLVEVQTGTIHLRETALGPLVHASLGVASSSSGRLVAKVREDVRSVGDERAIDLAILDGPSGIGAPVPVAIGRTDLVVAVAEPTPSGLHDLTRLLDLTAHLGLRTAIVTNRADLNPALAEEIGALASSREVHSLGQVPYDGEVARVVAGGGTPLALPPIREALEGVWSELLASLD